jgi:NAD-dependent dihydropyrimidine dehydrogenase PreA subunit
MEQPPRILFCNCAYADVIDAGRKRQVYDRLAAAGVPFEAVADLCGLAARKDPALAELAGSGGVAVVACYERAVRALFAAADAPLPDDARVLNMRAQGADEILEALGVDAKAGAAPAPEPPAADGEWVPWFPVIDAARCTNCKQCMNFCLFGVYARGDDGRVFVENPANCKTNCPACARICPAVAIIFPKHGSAPINGADPEAEPAPDAGPVNVNVAELLKGDVYEVLRRRQSQAADSRGCSCNVPADDQLGIPQEVLDGSPQLKAFLDRARRAGADGECCDDAC